MSDRVDVGIQSLSNDYLVVVLLFLSGGVFLSHVDILIQGLPIRTDIGSFGLCTIPMIEDGARILLDTGHYGTRRNLLEALKQRSMDPSDIDIVVLSHSNWDHVLNIDLFSNSRVLIHEDELNYAMNPRSDDWATPTFFRDLIRGMNVEPIRGEMELTKNVRIIETIGHTIGHISLLVSTEKKTLLFAQDALPSARSYYRELPEYIFYSEEEARKSILKIKGLNPDIIYPGHDRPFTVKGGQINYLSSGTIKVVLREEKEEDLWISLSHEKALGPRK